MYDKLMVVAHPDDESIFGGGDILSERGWKIICVTNGDNNVRRIEFTRSMKFAECNYEMWTYEDKWDGDFPRPSLTKDLQRVLDEREYTKIVTHNLQGEYGHTQHIALSEIMHSIVKKNLYTFGFGNEILPFEILRNKLNLLKIYRSQPLAIQNLMKYIIYERITFIN